MTDQANDELNSQQHELASAYLDGVATSAERVQVESSSELLALVESLGTLRTNLADTPTANPDARSAAFAAAFAAFDAALTDDTALTDAPTAAIIPLSPRRRWTRPLMSVAAAFLLVGVVGVAVKSFSGQNSKSSSVSVDPNAKMEAADAATSAQAAADWTAPSVTIGSIGGVAQAALIIETPQQLRALDNTAAADTYVPRVGAPESTAAASETTAAGAATMPSETFRTASRLPALDCLTDQQIFLADIQYQGTFAIAARDMVTGVTSAITDDCTVLASVGP